METNDSACKLLTEFVRAAENFQKASRVADKAAEDFVAILDETVRRKLQIALTRHHIANTPKEVLERKRKHDRD